MDTIFKKNELLRMDILKMKTINNHENQIHF